MTPPPPDPDELRADGHEPVDPAADLPQPADAEYEGDRPRPFATESQQDASRRRLLPVLVDLRSYSRMRLRTDVLAGVAIAALAVPQAMAYAQTAGLPVAAGLYGLLIPLVAYAALGSSQVLMTGPDRHGRTPGRARPAVGVRGSGCLPGPRRDAGPPRRGGVPRRPAAAPRVDLQLLLHRRAPGLPHRARPDADLRPAGRLHGGRCGRGHAPAGVRLLRGQRRRRHRPRDHADRDRIVGGAPGRRPIPAEVPDAARW